MYICPVCNGFYEYDKYCSICGAKMQILDRVENYYDDYSPYLSYRLTDLNDGAPPNICTHYCLCPYCGNKEVVNIGNIEG